MDQQQIEQGALEVFQRAWTASGGDRAGVKAVVAYMRGLEREPLTVTEQEAKEILRRSREDVLTWWHVYEAINTVLAQRARPAEASSDHVYKSTACYHAKHDRCRRQCKFCSVPCNCPCHANETQPTVQPYVYEEAQPAKGDELEAAKRWLWERDFMCSKTLDVADVASWMIEYVAVARPAILAEARDLANKIGKQYALGAKSCDEGGEVYHWCDMETHRANGCFEVASAIGHLTQPAIQPPV